MEYLLLIPAALFGFFVGYTIGNVKGSNKVFKDVLFERERAEFFKKSFFQLHDKIMNFLDRYEQRHN